MVLAFERQKVLKITALELVALVSSTFDSFFFVRLQVKAGTNLILQGTPGDFFYVVETGSFDFVVNGVNRYTAAHPLLSSNLAVIYCEVVTNILLLHGSTLHLFS